MMFSKDSATKASSAAVISQQDSNKRQKLAVQREELSMKAPSGNELLTRGEEDELNHVMKRAVGSKMGSDGPGSAPGIPQPKVGSVRAPLLISQRQTALHTWHQRERHPHRQLLMRHAETQLRSLGELYKLRHETAALQQAIASSEKEVVESEGALQQGLEDLLPDERRLQILKESLDAAAFKKYASKMKSALFQVVLHLARNGRNFVGIDAKFRQELGKRKSVIRVKESALVVPPSTNSISGKDHRDRGHLTELMTGAAFRNAMRWLLGRFAESQEVQEALATLHMHFDQDGRGNVKMEEVLRTIEKALPTAIFKIVNSRNKSTLNKFRTKMKEAKHRISVLTEGLRNAIPNSVAYTGMGLKIDPVCELFQVLPSVIGDLQCIWLDDNQLTGLNIHERKQLPFLTTLSLSNNHIAEFNGSIFQAFRALEVLRISQNLLVELPEEINCCPHLRELHADSNRLKCMPESLGSLSLLRVLCLQKNQIFHCPRDIFSRLKHLEELSLGHNLLKTLQLGKMPALRILHLQKNQFSSCPKISFKDYPSLKDLSLAGNGFESLHLSIGSLPLLEKLDISRNELTELPDDFGGGRSLSNLVSVDLSYNKFSFIAIQLEQLHSLESCNLQGNTLGTLSIGNTTDRPEESEDNDVKAEDLLASDPCGLSFLPSSLKSLNLQDNQIVNVGDQSLDHLTELQELRLLGNKLKDLPDCIADFQSLNYLTLDAQGFEDSLYEVISTGKFTAPEQEMGRSQRPNTPSKKFQFKRTRHMRGATHASENQMEKERIIRNSQNIAKAVVAHLQWRRKSRVKWAAKQEKLRDLSKPPATRNQRDMSPMDEICAALTSGKTFPVKIPTWQESYLRDSGNLHPTDRGVNFSRVAIDQAIPFKSTGNASFNGDGLQSVSSTFPHGAASNINATSQLLQAQEWAFRTYEQEQMKPSSASTFLVQIAPIGGFTKPLSLRISKDARVSQIKQMIAEQSGIAENDQVLIFGSEALSDQNFLGSYKGIKNRAEIGLLVAGT